MDAMDTIDTGSPTLVFGGGPFMNLTTFRRSGEAVSTPVWYAEQDGALYVMTGRDTGKVKRIRNNPMVMIGPSDRRGNPEGVRIRATARMLDGHAVQHADQLLNRKYGLQKRFFDVLGALSRRNGLRVYLEIRPDDAAGAR